MSKRKKAGRQPRQLLRQEISASSKLPFYTAAGIAIIVFAAGLVYIPALNGGFILDDDKLLTNNSLIRASNGLYRFWFSNEAIDYWPVANTSLWIEWRLWGSSPIGYHLTNLLLHVIDALLIWLILKKMSVPGAFLAALIFTVHPVNVESVAWIAQRKGLLALLFFLLSVWWYLEYLIRARLRLAAKRQASTDNQHRLADKRESPATKRVLIPNPQSLIPISSFILHPSSLYWLSLTAFILAMLSKGSVAILPLVLLWIVWWQKGTERDSPIFASQKSGQSPSALWELIRIVPFFLVSAVLTIVNLWFQTHGSGEVIRAAGFPERLQGAGSVVWFYLYKAIFPLNLAFIYPPWSIQSNSLLWWLPLAGALLVTAVFLRYEKTWARALLFAWGFFCTALVPVLGFVDIAFMKFTLVADHYQHIAIIGVIALATAGWSIWRQQIRGALRGTATLLAIGTVISLMSLSYRQNKLYCDAPTLYRATLQKNPKCWILHNNLGALMFQSGRVSEAIEHYHVALRENPDYADAHNNLGYALSQTGRVREAIRHYKTALRLKPVFPEVNNNLGLALAKAGHLPEAIVQYRLALRLQNDNPVFHLNLANALDEMNQETEAINHFKIALRLNPAYADAYNNLAVAFYKTDRLSEAIACLRQAIKLKSNNVDAYYNLTLAYAKANRQAEALLAAKTGLHMARMLNLPDKIKLFEDCLQPAAASASGHSKAPP